MVAAKLLNINIIIYIKYCDILGFLGGAAYVRFP
jgi:hypothetical protein